MKAGVSVLILSGWALSSAPSSPAQETSSICTCTCSLKRRDGSQIVVDTLRGAACSPCADSCCVALCAPILQQELDRRKVEKNAPAEPGDGVLLGHEMQDNVQDLLDFVLPQLKRGSGEIPFKAVADAMRVDELGVPEDVVHGIEARGAIAFSGGKGENRGEKFSGAVPTAYGTMRVNMAKTVAADVAMTADGRGMVLSRIKGLSLSLPIVRIPVSPSEISVSPVLIVVKYTIAGFIPVSRKIDLRRTAPRPQETP